MTEIRLICGNWGTSSLRAFGVSATGCIKTEILTGPGISIVPKEDQAQVWFDTVRSLLEAAPTAPHLLCGMAGSNLGWLSAGYVATPASLTTMSDSITWAEHRDHKVGIVPGLSGTGWAGQPERMRGEETEIIGWSALTGQKDGILCLPGTHTKWARLSGGAITDFNTALTGELFAALTSASLLKPTAPQAHSITAFEAGADLGLQGDGGDTLHRLFAARSTGLAGQIKPPHANAYLSGLLIGRDIAGAIEALPLKEGPVNLIGAGTLSRRFAHLLTLAGVQSRLYTSENCVAAGLAVLAKAGGYL